MKQIYILRHAKSSWENTKLSDFDRPLSKRGINDAVKLGKFIAAKNIRVHTVICSSAERTKDTFDLISKELDFSIEKAIYTDDLYYGEYNKIIETIRNLDENNSSILIVGHNPTLHILIEKLTNKFIHKFATCNLAKITSKNLWKDTSFGSCELKLLIKPNGIKN
tara:strand:+ start:4407 stop:4901 length:495 start_codon:yes stop_codon:yes gene_type:complete